MKPCSLYVHIPFCRSKCAYCDFFSLVCKNNIDEIYIKKLLEEAEARAVEFDVSEWKTIYFGGGTPSLLSANQIKELLENLKKIRPPAREAEITFECNPDDISIELLETLSENGVNRLSLGLQSMDDEPLRLVNRRARRMENLRALELISDYWIKDKERNSSLPSHLKHRFSVDLICGLPGQTRETFFQGLDEVMKCGADHISLYSLSLEENTPLYKDFVSGKISLPETEESDSWWIQARDMLEKNAFSQYEVSNFSLEASRSIHNMSYWKMLPYIGIGAGATGTAGSIRYTNSRSIKEWIDDNSEDREELPLNIQKFEYLMMGFRLLEGVDILEYQKRYKENINIIDPVFSKWCNRGLAGKTEERYFLNQKGILLLNRFLEEIIDFFE